MAYLRAVPIAIALLTCSALVPGAASATTPGGNDECGDDGCGPPPTMPPLPTAVTNTASYNIGYGYGDTGHSYSDYASGPAAVSLNTTADGSYLTAATTLAPVATVSILGHGSGGHDHESIGAQLVYTVTLHAADQAAADAITAKLGTSGSLARLYGSYTSSSSGLGTSIIDVDTGTEVAGALEVSSHNICDHSGYYDYSGSGCGTQHFSLAVNFASASGFAGGDPLDFIGSVKLSAFVGIGDYRDTGLVGTGDAAAFIDPVVKLLDPTLGTLTIGGGTVSNASPGAAVPEPAIWAMFVLGFGFVGASLRRGSAQRRPVRVAA